MTKAPALAAQRLQVSLGGRRIVDVPALTLPAGRWTAVVGPNGAGKTTLLKAMAHLLPAHGSVQLLGRRMEEWPGKARARTLSWLGQGEAGTDDLLAQDVVMLGRLPHQAWLAAPSAADHAAIERAMRRTQCWEWRKRPLGQLSGGERQRVLLARAFAVEAEVLLMDEPLANLDAPHQADWLLAVRELVVAGRTVVSVLHELGMALHADELLVLQCGRPVHQGASDDPVTHAALRDVFDKRIEIHKVAGEWVVLPR
ncbi:ABC transporter ATP-binding protein [Variovorax robiniae]|uniref:ABC transporter ATP-binding protein n=1 Tax=Variovorax robiniae TaxID=1836199 RepID=A0ABU8X9K0_9BURK